jgi:hypothetical protein
MLFVDQAFVIKTFVILIFHLELCVLAVDPGLAQLKHRYAIDGIRANCCP